MDFEEEPGSDEPEPTILDPGQLGNDRVQMTESQIQVANMGEKYKVRKCLDKISPYCVI